MFLFRCPCSCRGTFLIPEEMAGQVYRCPCTSQPIRLPPVLPNNFTEESWLACHAPHILATYANARASPRKKRLLECAFVRSVCDERTRKLLEPMLVTAEAFADRQVRLMELERARLRFESDLVSWSLGEDRHRIRGLAGWAFHLHANCSSQARTPEEGALHCAYVRDALGNPFRCPPLIRQTWLSSNDEAVLRVARAIYAKRAFEHMPILADALEDADCDDGAILEHCRGDGPHILGCWVVDALLGKR